MNDVVSISSPTGIRPCNVFNTSTGFLNSLMAWDSVLFAAICVLDMLSTIYFVRIGAATEANPLLAGAIRAGIGCFVAVKLCSFVPALSFAAYYRYRFSGFIATSLRLALIAYVTVYSTCVGSQFH